MQTSRHKADFPKQGSLILCYGGFRWQQWVMRTLPRSQGFKVLLFAALGRSLLSFYWQL